MIELLSEAVLATCCEEHRVGLESRIDQEIHCDQSEDSEKWACLWLQGFSLLARFKAFCLDLTVCCLQTAEQAPLDLLPCKQFIWFFPQFLTNALKAVDSNKQKKTEKSSQSEESCIWSFPHSFFYVSVHPSHIDTLWSETWPEGCEFAV